MKPDKEYYRKYYRDHKKKLNNRHKEWQRNNYDKVRKIKRKYHEKNQNEISLKEKKLIAFKRKLSPEVRAKIEENTKINNKHIKVIF